jgi:hypothetical protein
MALAAFPLSRADDVVNAGSLMERLRAVRSYNQQSGSTDRANVAGEKKPTYFGMGDWTGGAPIEGGDSDGNGEVGTITRPSTSGTGYLWHTQHEKALFLNTVIAKDVTLNYGTGVRGEYSPEDRYVSVNEAETPAQFRRSNYTPPVVTPAP